MTLRVGLLGPVNNTAYGMASGLHTAGVDVVYVRSSESTLPTDQPVWEDLPFTMSAEEFAASRGWSWWEWTDFEARSGWNPPSWLVDPAQSAASRGRYRPAAGTDLFLRAAMSMTGRRRPRWAEVQRSWSACDVLLVSGSRPAMLAAASGLPYLVWPHGSDVRTAIRDFAPNIRGARARGIAEVESALLRRAYRGSRSLVTHDPLLVTGDHRRAQEVEGLAPVRFLAWPISTTPVLSRAVRREALGTVLDAAGVAAPSADLVALVASRIDYRLKGHDRLISAISSLGDRGIHYLVVGWGADLPRARAELAAAGLGERVTLLPRIMSKPVIRQLQASVDVSFDQFVFGTYGFVGLEAMAAGTPVVMAVDDEAFDRKGWEAPPALRARSATDVLSVLRKVAGGHVDLEAVGVSGQSWVERRHGPHSVRSQLEAVCGDVGISGGTS